MVCFLTDGTEHAVQEGLGLCAHMVNSVEGKPRPAWSVGLKPVGETCGIHGLALEENGGITAAMPGEYHTHGALLLWEIVASQARAAARTSTAAFGSRTCGIWTSRCSRFPCTSSTSI